jgi:flavodoxin
MRVGIIVYSQTGNTFSVGEIMKGKLTAEGHLVNLDRITIEGEPPKSAKKVYFENQPRVDIYKDVIFGAPVQGFRLAMVMDKYLSEVGSLKGKKVHLFVTKGLASKWTGGNGAIKKMRKMCEAKGAEIGETGMVFWKDKYKDKMMDDLIARIDKAL